MSDMAPGVPGEAERAVDVRHHRRGRYPTFRRVVSRYPIVRRRLERASTAERMPPPEPVAHPGSSWTKSRTERTVHRAGLPRRALRSPERSHPSRPLPATAAAPAVLVSAPRTPDAITQLIRRSSLCNRATLPFAVLEVSEQMVAVRCKHAHTRSGTTQKAPESQRGLSAVGARAVGDPAALAVPH